MPLAPKILFEDTHLLVISKPAGLLSQGEHKGEENVVDYLRSYLGRHYVGLIHRLDRNTSGLMVIAKRTKAAQRLSQALRNGQLQRTYLGWITGKLDQKVKWVHFLEKDTSKNQVRVASKNHGKESILTAKPVRHAIWGKTPVTLAQFQLETGRSHQIRAQAAYEGFPLLGDRKYGIAPTSGFKRLALHSYHLEFPHPMSGEILRFDDPSPFDLRDLV